MFSRFTSKANTSTDEFHERCLFLLMFGSIVLLAPIILPSLIGGYIFYWAIFFNYQRIFLRTGIAVVTFSGMLFSFWEIVLLRFKDVISGFLKVFSPKLPVLIYGSTNSFLITIVALSVVGSSLVAAWLYYKGPISEVPYARIRRMGLLMTMPIRLGVDIYNRFPKDNLILWMFAFAVGLAVIQLPLLGLSVLFSWLGHKSVGYILCALYLLLGAYSLYVAKSDQSIGDFIIKNNRNSGGVNIGNIIFPRRSKLVLPWKDINHHIHILGQPGSGKSVLLRNFYAHQILTGQGMMLIDLKADVDVKSEIQGLVDVVNRKEDLLVIDLSNPSQSSGYNPLLRGGASELKDKILSSIDWSEPYYKKVAERFLLIVLNGLVVMRDDNKLVPTLADVHECLSYPESIERLASKLSKTYLKERVDLLELAKDLKDKKIFSDLTGIRTDIEVMLKSNFGEILTRPNAVDIYEAIISKKIIFVELDGQTYRETAVRLGRMLISDLRSASGAIVSKTSKSERPQFTVIVDEFADIVSNEEMGQGFVSLLNRCRGSGIGVIIAHQSLGDFKDERTKTQILDSTETTISFTQKDPDSCEKLASIVGTQETVSVTEQTESFLIFTGATGRGTQKLTYEFIFHPNEFKNLDVGEAIYVSKRPHRYGKLKVRHIKVPMLLTELADQSWQDSDPKLLSSQLSLKQERQASSSLEGLKGANAYEARLALAVEADI